MASPVDANRVASTSGADATPTFDLPANIAAGDLLVVVWRSGQAIANPHQAPTDWHMMQSSHDVDNSDDRMGGFWKRATGSEGSTVTMPDMGTAASWVALAWRITGGRSSPEMHQPTNQTGPSSAPDPPTHTKHGEAEDMLWLAVGCAEDNNQSFVSAPTNYSNGFGIVSVATGAPGCSIDGASRQVASSLTENPGTFSTGGNSNAMMVTTIAILPEDPDFPEAEIVTTAVTADSTPTFNLPSGVVADDVLIVAWRSSDTLSNPNALPSGWTTLVASTSGDGSGDHAGAMWKRAAGGETDVTMADFGTAANFTAVAWKVTNAKDPVASTMASAASANLAGDPPSLDPAGGTADFLWLAFISTEDAHVTKVAPQGYEKLATVNVSSGASGCMAAGAQRALRADSDDPDVFWTASDSLRRMLFTAALEFEPPPAPDLRVPIPQVIQAGGMHW